MTLADTIIDRFRGPLSRLLGAVRGITDDWGPRHDWVEPIRGIVYRAADPLLRRIGRSTVRIKGDQDYVTTANVSPEAVEEALPPRYSRNILATKKARYFDGSLEWTVGSWVYDPDDTNWQHHPYFFANEDGTTDIYAHKETSAEHDPHGHVSDEQIHGDPNNRIRTLLDKAGIDYERRDIDHEHIPYPKLMSKNKTKKSLLALGTAVLPTGVTMVVQGDVYQGGVLAIIGLAAIVAYDVLDDKTKEVILEGLTTDSAKEVAESAGEAIEDTLESDNENSE